MGDLNYRFRVRRGTAAKTAVDVPLDGELLLAKDTLTLTVGDGVTAGGRALAKASVGLGNVDNTSDANKPVSTAQGEALALKAPLASPAFTGAPTAPDPTSAAGVATKGYVDNAIAAGGGGGGSASFIGARVVLAASQSIANATRQKVQWASADYDTSGFFAAGTPTRLTVPASLGGRYLVGACIIWTNASGGSIRQFEIQRNNGTPYLVTEGKLPMGANYFVGEYACVQVMLSDGDYVEVVAYQDSGSALNVIHHTTYGHINAFWLQRLG